MVKNSAIRGKWKNPTEQRISAQKRPKPLLDLQDWAPLPTKGQSHVHRMNLGFGPTRSRKDEKEAEKKKLQNKLEKVARNANVYTNLT